MKPEKPITRKEMYLDVATGGSTELPSPVTREEKYLAKIAGESVDVPTPVTRYEMLLAAVAGESYTLTPVTRLEIYLAKAAGQDIEVPQPITREEMYWFDYVGGQPTPSEQEYTGAVPVTFVADGTPLLDFLISGNAAQSGTPTPDNPIMPQGTGERTGNLFDKNATDTNNGYINNGYLKSDGSINTNADYRVSEYIKISQNQSYNLYYGSNLNIPSVCFYDSAKNYISGDAYAGRRDVPFTTPQNAEYLRLSFRAIDYPIIMLNLGSTRLPYEPYGIKIPISSGDTTTPVYLGDVESTRRIVKLVLDGNTSINDYAGGASKVGFVTQSAGILGNRTLGKCTHFQTQTTGAGSTIDGVTFGINNSTIYFTFSAASVVTYNLSDVASIKQYLADQYSAGTPVTIWYVLATEETGIVNEPLMKIGDYADTLSMEQAGVQIPTANGSTTLDVETTVSPSEVYIKYRGEAVATLSTLSAEVSSPEAVTEEVNPEETEETENGSEDISLQHEFEAIE